ncbi:amidase [Marinomonas transparens]|uniref:Amidase n=1 Tax=Marinomonas transparens TaxID=2795388 RepID=A0A934N7T6_9GAMM|nr:amidase [Marinomonas transparens]MBJ7539396.1 amidase [Marinomonas transparens]
MKHSIVQNPFLTLGDNSVKITSKALNNKSLSGLRLAVKDLFHMAGLPTSAGNPSWLASHDIPTQTASSVQALLDAGADFCGKTITDELAYSLNGQNIHYGTPSNPVTPDRLPGGSSSGSVVAVSLGLADIGLGTDTGGSIRVPASYNGLFGLRPTHGAIAADNMVALAPSFDTVGWITKDLNILEKTASVLFKGQVNQKLSHVLVADNLIESVAHGKALQKQFERWFSRSVFSAAAMDISVLNIDTKAWKTGETFRTLQGSEIWQEHGDWFIQTNPVMAPDIQARFQWCATISDDEINAAQQQRKQFTDWLLGAIAGSVLIIPTTPGLSPLFTASDDELADYRNQLMDLTAIAGLAGLPQLHLPVCELDGVPCGLSLVGPRNSDLELIQIAKKLME